MQKENLENKMTLEQAKAIRACNGKGYSLTDYINALNMTEPEPTKGCKDCWHNYHCPMPQDGYDYNPDTCEYNEDNK